MFRNILSLLVGPVLSLQMHKGAAKYGSFIFLIQLHPIFSFILQIILERYHDKERIVVFGNSVD